MPLLDVTVTGDTVVIDTMNGIVNKGENLAPAFSDIAEMMLESHNANFKAQGTRFGSQWPPRAHVYPWPILEKTGKMKKSFTATSNATEAVIANSTKYYRFHHLGTRRLPQRNLIGLAGDGGKTDINEAVRILRKHLNIGAENV